MMKMFQSNRRTLIGTILIVLSIIFFILWEAVGRAWLLYPNLLVAAGDMSQGAVVTTDQLRPRRVSYGGDGALLASDAKKIEGKVAIQTIKAGEPLYLEYFEDAEMSTKGGSEKFVFSLPQQWIESYPQSLRRGDEAYIYCNGAYITCAKVAYVKDGNNQEITSKDRDRLQGSGLVSVVELLVSKEQASSISQIGNEGGRFVILYN